MIFNRLFELEWKIFMHISLGLGARTGGRCPSSETDSETKHAFATRGSMFTTGITYNLKLYICANVFQVWPSDQTHSAGNTSTITFTTRLKTTQKRWNPMILRKSRIATWPCGDMEWDERSVPVDPSSPRIVPTSSRVYFTQSWSPVWQTGSEYCCFSRIFNDLVDSKKNLLRNYNGKIKIFDNHVEFHEKTSKTIILIIVR